MKWDKPRGLRKVFYWITRTQPVPVAMIINGDRYECRSPEKMSALLASVRGQDADMTIVLR